MAETSSRSRLVTALLAFPLPLGVFGAHRFYIGKTITAIVMLILIILYLVTIRFWTILWISLAVVFLWAFIDFILIIFGIMKDRDGKPIKTWQI